MSNPVEGGWLVAIASLAVFLSWISCGRTSHGRKLVCVCVCLLMLLGKQEKYKHVQLIVIVLLCYNRVIHPWRIRDTCGNGEGRRRLSRSILRDHAFKSFNILFII